MVAAKDNGTRRASESVVSKKRDMRVIHGNTVDIRRLKVLSIPLVRCIVTRSLIHIGMNQDLSGGGCYLAFLGIVPCPYNFFPISSRET